MRVRFGLLMLVAAACGFGCQSPPNIWAGRMMKQLSDADPGARRRAAEALGHEGAVMAAAALARVLGDKEPSVREAAAEALVRIGPATARALLFRHFRSRGETAALASETLLRLGPKAAPYIAGDFEQHRPEQQIQILQFLGKLGGKEAETEIRRVQKLIRDEDVHAAADEALRDARRRRMD